MNRVQKKKFEMVGHFPRIWLAMCTKWAHKNQYAKLQHHSSTTLCWLWLHTSLLSMKGCLIRLYWSTLIPITILEDYILTMFSLTHSGYTNVTVQQLELATASNTNFWATEAMWPVMRISTVCPADQSWHQYH